jgi:ABC-type transporter Mla MlaB component
MKLPEDVTLANARTVRDAGVAACKALARGAEWVIDAAALKRFDSGLLSTLLEWQRAAKTQGVSLSLKGMSEPVSVRLHALATSYGIRDILALA